MGVLVGSASDEDVASVAGRAFHILPALPSPRYLLQGRLGLREASLFQRECRTQHRVPVLLANLNGDRSAAWIEAGALHTLV